MKALLTLLLSFYVLSCSKSSNDESHADSNINEDVSVSEEPIFTITHKTTDDEKVIIFIKPTGFDQKSLASLDSDSILSTYPYEVTPKECLQVTASHFEHLIIIVGEGGFWNDNIKTLCGDSNKCQPGNYKIINQSEWSNDYVMVEDNSTNYNCVEMTQWMSIKNPKLI